MEHRENTVRNTDLVPGRNGGTIHRPWRPGETGNPGGRPKSLVGAAMRRRLERDPELLEKLIDQFLRLALNKGGGTPHHVRLASLEAIRDTTEGRPAQAVEVMTEDTSELRGLLEDMRDALNRPKPA